jgi:hypothetical protein
VSLLPFEHALKGVGAWSTMAPTTACTAPTAASRRAAHDDPPRGVAVGRRGDLGLVRDPQHGAGRDGRSRSRDARPADPLGSEARRRGRVGRGRQRRGGSEARAPGAARRANRRRPPAARPRPCRRRPESWPSRGRQRPPPLSCCATSASVAPTARGPCHWRTTSAASRSSARMPTGRSSRAAGARGSPRPTSSPWPMGSEPASATASPWATPPRRAGEPHRSTGATSAVPTAPPVST